jgi:hypothetical protein
MERKRKMLSDIDHTLLSGVHFDKFMNSFASHARTALKAKEFIDVNAQIMAV